MKRVLVHRNDDGLLLRLVEEGEDCESCRVAEELWDKLSKI
jgi:hypothetical protein